MATQFYFASKQDKICYPKNYFLDLMEYEGWHEMTVFKAEPHKVEGLFWCRFFDDHADKEDDPCGKQCRGYAPKNGQSGCCKNYSLKFYEPTDEVVVFKNKKS